MWNRSYLTRSRFLLLLSLVCILLSCIGYIQYIYTFNILPDKRVQQDFIKTQCFLISKKLNIKGHFFRSYRADFLVSYTVNGVNYSRWLSGNGLDKSYNRTGNEQEDILSQFEVGGAYSCYYNPSNPKQAVLVFRHDWLSTFPLMIPAAFSALAFYYLVKNLVWLITQLIHHRKEQNP